MFQNLKTNTGRLSEYRNLPNAGTYPSEGFCKIPSATTFEVKGNEADRLVRCRICGFPCDMERDAKAKDNTWAGLGVQLVGPLTAGASIGDREVSGGDSPDNIRITVDEDERITTDGSVRITTDTMATRQPDTYYTRNISGCPACGCLTFYL